MAAHVHEYSATLSWHGSTAIGYESYDRNHEMLIGERKLPLAMSGDAAFHGDPAHLNPEQLLLAAASSCQMLSFLAVAARARIDVVAYEDDCRAYMPEDDEPLRVTRIALRPRITISAAGRELDRARLERYVAVAHEECFIARSLRSSVEIDPEFILR